MRLICALKEITNALHSMGSRSMTVPDGNGFTEGIYLLRHKVYEHLVCILYGSLAKASAIQGAAEMFHIVPDFVNCYATHLSTTHFIPFVQSVIL